MSYVVAISAFFVVAAFAAFIKFDCGNAAELQAKAAEVHNARQAKLAAESKNVYMRQFDEAVASFN